LINQYEQVMQLMHQEMTKLIEQNKQLKDQLKSPSQVAGLPDQQAMQMQFQF
jgi:uncharacterized protein YukE